MVLEGRIVFEGVIVLKYGIKCVINLISKILRRKLFLYTFLRGYYKRGIGR